MPEQVDCYLLHAPNRERLQRVIDPKRDGRIRYLGFSFHDEAPVFRASLHPAP